MHMPIAAHDFLQDDEFEEFAEEGASLLILLHICSSLATPAMRAVCITPPIENMPPQRVSHRLARTRRWYR
jgi:hypothetical protein